jgi:steroid delta-isomerase-like uncharacterized protein
MADNADLARSMYDAFNRRDFDLSAELTAPDGALTIIGTGQTFVGAEGARQYNAMWDGAFPDGMVTVDRVTAHGDLVFVEYTGRGTQTGTLVTGAGDIPATGRSATLQFVDVLEFADGRIKKQHVYFDTGSLMAQLGIGAAESTGAE